MSETPQETVVDEVPQVEDTVVEETPVEEVPAEAPVEETPKETPKPRSRRAKANRETTTEDTDTEQPDHVALFVGHPVFWPGVGSLAKGYNLVSRELADKWIEKGIAREASPEEVAKAYGV